MPGGGGGQPSQAGSGPPPAPQQQQQLPRYHLVVHPHHFPLLTTMGVWQRLFIGDCVKLRWKSFMLQPLKLPRQPSVFFVVILLVKGVTAVVVVMVSC